MAKVSQHQFAAGSNLKDRVRSLALIQAPRRGPEAYKFAHSALEGLIPLALSRTPYSGDTTNMASLSRSSPKASSTGTQLFDASSCNVGAASIRGTLALIRFFETCSTWTTLPSAMCVTSTIDLLSWR